ncbi:MAG: class I SAM-dependent methyltransferase [Saprospiraceae bacterium]|nr:class I SAM-dependent methyltransferase [Saprospiraceae bacterium]
MNAYAETARIWDQLADLYQEKFMDVDIYNDSYDIFCQWIPAAGARILEIGCGPGNIARYMLLQRPDFQWEGTDVAPGMAELAQKNNPTASFRVMDARDIGQLQGPYDGIICGFCIPYLTKEDTHKLIESAARLLPSGGIFYLSFMLGDYAQSGWETNSRGDSMPIYYYAEADLLPTLEQCGLHVSKKLHTGFGNKTGKGSIHAILISEKR